MVTSINTVILKSLGPKRPGQPTYGSSASLLAKASSWLNTGMSREELKDGAGVDPVNDSACRIYQFMPDWTRSCFWKFLNETALRMGLEQARSGKLV
jgi:hypothetical protein